MVRVIRGNEIPKRDAGPGRALARFTRIPEGMIPVTPQRPTIE